MALVRTWHYRAGKVRALLTVSNKRLLSGANQHAVVVRFRVIKDERASHRNLIERREIGRALGTSSFEIAKILYGMITAELVVLKKKSSRGASDEESGELVDLAARIRAVAEEYIGDSAHKTIEKHFLHALDGIMSGDGERAVDAMVLELEKAASLLRGLAVTERLRSRITELRAVPN